MSDVLAKRDRGAVLVGRGMSNAIVHKNNPQRLKRKRSMKSHASLTLQPLIAFPNDATPGGDSNTPGLSRQRAPAASLPTYQAIRPNSRASQPRRLGPGDRGRPDAARSNKKA